MAVEQDGEAPFFFVFFAVCAVGVRSIRRDLVIVIGHSHPRTVFPPVIIPSPPDADCCVETARREDGLPRHVWLPCCCADGALVAAGDCGEEGEVCEGVDSDGLV